MKYRVLDVNDEPTGFEYDNLEDALARAERIAGAHVVPAEVDRYTGLRTAAGAAIKASLLVSSDSVNRRNTRHLNRLIDATAKLAAALDAAPTYTDPRRGGAATPDWQAVARALFDAICNARHSSNCASLRYHNCDCGIAAALQQWDEAAALQNTLDLEAGHV